MRKQTVPRTRKRRHISSRKQPGLIAQDLSAPQSAAQDSVLDNHSHRTRIRHNCLIILSGHPRRINGVFFAQLPDYAELHKQFVWINRQEAESRRRGRPIALPRLSAPPKSAPSRRLRRLTTARPGLGLVLGLERPSHTAGTFPRSHELGIIAEPIADHLVQQAGPHPLTPSPPRYARGRLSGRGGTKGEFLFAPLGRVLVA